MLNAASGTTTCTGTCRPRTSALQATRASTSARVVCSCGAPLNSGSGRLIVLEETTVLSPASVRSRTQETLSRPKYKPAARLFDEGDTIDFLQRGLTRQRQRQR